MLARTGSEYYQFLDGLATGAFHILKKRGNSEQDKKTRKRWLQNYKFFKKRYSYELSARPHVVEQLDQMRDAISSIDKQAFILIRIYNSLFPTIAPPI